LSDALAFFTLQANPPVPKVDGATRYFMKDVEFLLRYLGIEKFSVRGVSGSGPYALAAAYHFPKKRLLKTLVLYGSTHPGYKAISIHLGERLDRWALRWIPFYYRT
jgi:pimeloyl-ACP methyl ester carboxylesterase